MLYRFILLFHHKITFLPSPLKKEKKSRSLPKPDILSASTTRVRITYDRTGVR